MVDHVATLDRALGRKSPDPLSDDADHRFGQADQGVRSKPCTPPTQNSLSGEAGDHDGNVEKAEASGGIIAIV